MDGLSGKLGHLMMRGRGPVRMREASSRKVTSLTQWTLFSMVHWPRT